MEENKFEKQVQQKMDELRLTPSESVWEHVKARIAKKKDRRTGLLILLLLLILLVPGVYWLYNSNTSSNSNNRAARNEAINSNENNLSKTNQLTKPADKEAQLGENENAKSSDVKSSDNLKNEMIIAKENTLSKQKKYRENTKVNFSVKQLVPEVEESIELTIPESLENKKAVAEFHNTFSNNKNHVSIVQHPAIEKEKVPVDPLAGALGTQYLAKTEIKHPEAIIDLNNPIPLTVTPTGKWHVGIFIAGGYSHVGNQLFGFGGYADAQNLNATPGTGSTNGGQFIYSPSKVKTGGAIVAGLLLEKNISAKAMISFGLNYKAFNTVNVVGPKNDTTGMYQSLRASVDQHQYHNNFTFIELPVQLNLQLTKGKSLPIFWTAGITLSQMISSNALQFNQYTGTYYKDNTFFNKTQINLNTGFSVAVYQGSNNSILLGPYISYAMSKMANEGSYNGKHFVFFGLHSQILFRKNN